ncbi:MAG: isoquinoline 1-oxidoreductase subunit beta [Verrucomicrobiota bacterium]|jgi:isoquinoline 1-oxidoreductase beta subunit
MITSRRAFLKTAALGGASLVIAFDSRRLFAAEAKDAAQFKPNGWIRIDGDGTVTLTIGKSEMGQGVRTSLAMILADELEADWSRVKLVQASPGPEFKRLGTGGSFSLGGSWKPLRQAAAAAREMLIASAAAQWKVEAASCAAANGAVVHTRTKRRLEYAALVAEAAKLPVPADPPLKKPSDFRLIGKATNRIDGRDIVTGAARYGIDTKVPGMLYASIERPPFAGAKPKRSQEEKAKKIRGVRRIVQCSCGIAVVAESTWAAMKGRTALAVEWEEPPKDAFDSEAHWKRLEEASREKGFVTRKEEPPAGPGVVTRTIDATYYYPFYAHAPVETMNCVADVRDDRCTIWAPTQAPNSLQEAVAKFLGTTPEKVDVNVTLIGGGFGRRLAVDYALEAAEVSRAVKAPVQVLWTRTDDMQHGHFQAASAHRLSAGFGAEGDLVTWKHTKAGSFHNLRLPDPAAVRDAGFYQDLSWGVYDLPYAIPAIETAYVTVDLPVKHGPWRAVFSPSSVFARESFLDEVIREGRADPIDFRLSLLEGAEEVKAGSLTIDRRRLRRVLEVLQEKSQGGGPNGVRYGRGVACNVYDGETHIAYAADVLVDDNGTVHVKRVVAVVDCGLVVNPTGVQQQIEGGILWGISSALGGEITFRGGAAQQATYADYRVARMRDTPVIEVHIIPSDATQPYGMGEPPVPPIVPAITNAIYIATGKRIRRLPVRAEDLKKA